MTASIALYVALTLVLASWALVHALATAAAWTRAASPRERAFACFPPTAPVAAARAGRRALALAWGVLAALYFVLLAIAL
ncbi:hypothetical protein [Sandaracinus amylolyticus]|uniref:Uncharacterized protein n=1 Tax=Sandaracinus amylolyticus TaxID=927083 RepID=A0A0F6W9E1_9BACT|nr:hypothetical protein [Sandaracinus amylolyticus]AKF10748.1 hypothetical protein DB32_007897 [Sandaracinus amylolyticus]